MDRLVVDLVERAEALFAIGAAHGKPVLRFQLRLQQAQRINIGARPPATYYWTGHRHVSRQFAPRAIAIRHAPSRISKRIAVPQVP